MHVLVVTQINDRSELALYAGLRKSGVEIRVLCAPGAPERTVLEEAGVATGEITVRHRLDLAAVRELRNVLVQEGPFDILYAPRNRGLSVALMASRGLPVKCVGYRGTLGHLSRFDPASWLTYLHPGLDHIVCNCDAVRTYLAGMGIAAERLTTIYKGHDVAWYQGSGIPSRRELSLPDDAVIAGFVGNMRAVKGVEVLLEAAAALPADPPVHFLLVGDIRHRRLARMADRMRSHARIHFTGYRSDAPALMSAMDLFVMPSLSREGVPRAVVEAMAQGIPPIVTRVGGMPELVEHEQQGLVVPPRDPRALRDAILQLAGDPGLRRRLGEQAQKRIQSRLTIEDCVTRTLQLYKRLVTP